MRFRTVLLVCEQFDENVGVVHWAMAEDDVFAVLFHGPAALHRMRNDATVAQQDAEGTKFTSPHSLKA